MNQVERHSAARIAIRRTGWVFAGAAGLLAVACLCSYEADSAQLQRIARDITEDESGDVEKIITLGLWVHNNKGFHENDNYFVFRKLRATPLQVVEGGGDCADKSRLLCALLREVGIRSTMVMCFHRQTGVPTHTVVEAQTRTGQYMIVDPVYGLNFPKNSQGDYFGLLDLRADPQILDRRLSDLLATSPRHSAIRSYNTTSAAYDRASSINWDRNVMTRAAHALLAAWYGDEVYRIRRPVVLEEPKLMVAAAFLLVAASILLITRIVASLQVRIAMPVQEGIALCGR